MIEAKEAYDIMSKTKSNISSMLETSNYFMFGISDNTNTEALDVIEKKTGEISVLWIWDILPEMDKGFKQIDISQFNNKGPDNNGPSVSQKLQSLL